jgi:3,8-divinyl protochlorophyllide a 8-vinyl-reductase (ferredoxin)
VMSSGDRSGAVQQGIAAYDNATTIPMWLASVINFVVNKIGPRGLEYGRFSIDSHFIRNYLYTKRNYPQKLEAHVPEFAKRIISKYKLPKY